MTQELEMISGAFLGLCVPESGIIPITSKYIDVVRLTNTTLDVLLESRSWNVDGGLELSGPWTSFKHFTALNEKPPDGYTWSVERLTKIQATSRPDYSWPGVWSSMSKICSIQGEALLVDRDTDTRRCSEVEEYSFHRSGRHEVQGHHEKRA